MRDATASESSFPSVDNEMRTVEVKDIVQLDDIVKNIRKRFDEHRSILFSLQRVLASKLRSQYLVVEQQGNIVLEDRYKPLSYVMQTFRIEADRSQP